MFIEFNSFLKFIINNGVLGIVDYIVIVFIGIEYVHKSSKQSFRFIYFGVIALVTGEV